MRLLGGQNRFRDLLFHKWKWWHQVYVYEKISMCIKQSTLGLEVDGAQVRNDYETIKSSLKTINVCMRLSVDTRHETEGHPNHQNRIEPPHVHWSSHSGL